jgi:hypothetical protein
MTLAAQLPEAATTTEQDAPALNRTRFDTTLVISGLTIVAIMLLWALAANLKLVSAVFLPSPLTVVKSLGTVATAGFVDSTLAQHTLASLGRIFGALAAAIIIGVPAGVAIASTRSWNSCARFHHWPICRLLSSGSASARPRKSRSSRSPCCRPSSFPRRQAPAPHRRITSTQPVPSARRAGRCSGM